MCLCDDFFFLAAKMTFARRVLYRVLPVVFVVCFFVVFPL